MVLYEVVEYLTEVEPKPKFIIELVIRSSFLCIHEDPNEPLYEVVFDDGWVEEYLV